MAGEDTHAQGTGRRDALDRLLVRSPRLSRLAARAVVRVPPGTPLRRRLTGLQIRRGFEAMARSDVDMVVSFYEPDAEVWMRTMTGVGISECYRGHAGIRALYADLDDAFERWWWVARGLVDGGDRIAIRADFTAFGRASGAKTAVTDGGTAIRYSHRGLATWQEWFADQGGWTAALAAVDLSDLQSPLPGA
jgi:hypothetical protein